MNISFSSEQEILRKSVAEFLSKECPGEKVRDIEDSVEGYSAKQWKKIAKLGWMEVILPEVYGGFDDPFMNIIIIMEEIGKAAFPSPFFSTVILGGYTILEGGSENQKKDLLKKMAEGKLLLSLAQHEDDPGYLEAAINMQATLSGDEYVLNGTKMFVMDANIADKLIVAAKTDEGTTLLLVDAKAPGITCTIIPSIGMDNCCEVIFADVKVPVKDTIGEPGKGWEILEKVMLKASIAKSAEMVGGCKASIDLTAFYAKNRVQYGQPIGGYQAIQHYMADMLMYYDISSNYLYKVAWMIDEGMDCSTEASALKAQVNEYYKFISERGVQIHGGVGTSREFDIGLYYRRAKAFEYTCGDSDHHIELVAKAIGL
ncbi:MAG: acyl-CoA dehydrogenase [Desulfobacterales bacterium]|jgi:alkylation response protein AidB-like acyl-CoA dehydrogenase|nr:acyl-CoA dehydrogenase [Desulfobacteraceae bacterium]MBT4364650.1 acyl-CoA dehydrogenase [Desulfobacteraceae bacterium]MBT7086013.1 acyl-CoA dehydrogenase [Desulfobacterales bacterium]